MQKEIIKDLVKTAQNNNQDAFSELLSIYDPLIQSMVAKFKMDGMTSADVEDMKQEAVLAFYNALVAYDPQFSEVEFGLYAKVCVYNRLVSHVKSVKKYIAANTLSLGTDELLKYVSSEGDPSRRIIEQEEESALLKIIRASLSDMENRVFDMYVSGMSAAEMSARLDMTEKSVSNTVYRIRKKLKMILQKNN